MMYLWPSSSSMAGFPPTFGVMTAPHRFSVPVGIQEGRNWGCDNGAFTRGFEPEQFFVHLEKLQPHRTRCLFIVVPDAVGAAVATLALWHEWHARICEYGPVAFVCQDGQRPGEIPECDAVFIGGTTAWKMSPDADACIHEGKRRGVWVHVGRVNSQLRMRHFAVMEVDSVDGTDSCWHPDRSQRLFSVALAQPALFSLVSGGDRAGEPE